MDHSESITALTKALVAARPKFAPLGKDQVARVEGRTGGVWTYGYCDLNTLLQAVQPALTEQEVLILQFPTADGGQVSVETRLVHAPSGEWISHALTLPVVGLGAQAVGSGISYARRYLLLAMLALMPGGEDDDGVAAQATPARAAGRTAPPATTRERDPEDALLAIRQGLELAVAGGSATLSKALNVLTARQRAAIGFEAINEMRKRAAAKPQPEEATP